MKNTLAISSIVGGKSSGGGGTGGAVDSVNGKTGTVVLTGNDLSLTNEEGTKVSEAIAANTGSIIGISADLNDLEVQKQDKLTAGKNISIVDNVISAGGFTNETLVGGKDIEIVPLEPVGGIDSNTSLLLHFDRNLTDSSLNKIAYTTSGTGNYTESHTGFGEAVCISGGTVEYAHDTAFNFGTGDWSIDFWAMITSTSDAGGYLLFTNNGATVFNAKIENGVMSFFLTTDPAPTFTYNIETVGVFNHFAFERKDGTVYWFLNGIPQGSVAHADTMADVTSFVIHNTGNNSVYFDELRIEKGYAPFETTGFEVSKYPYTESADNSGIHVVNYTGKAYTQSNLLAGTGIEIIDEPVQDDLDENTLACFHFDGDALNCSQYADGDTYTNTDLRTDSNITYVAGKFGQGIAALTTPDSNHHFINNAVYLPKYDEITLEYWVKLNGAINNAYDYPPRILLFGRVDSSSGGWGETYISYYNGWKVIINLPQKSGLTAYLSTEIINTLDQTGWNHIALCCKKGEFIKVYVNGILAYTTTEYTSLNPYQTTDSGILNFHIGNVNMGIDEVRYSKVLRYTGDRFTPQTKPFSKPVPTGNKVINSTVTSGVTAVNTKTGDVTLTADDINVTYTHDGAETTTSIKEFADTIDHDIENINNLMPGIATATVAGTVKPDGTSIAIDETGTISTVNTVQSTTITTIVKLTQAEYDALETKDDKTLYYIV